MDLQNLLNINLDNYGLSIEGYLGDIYLPWRTLILVLLIALGLRGWNKWRNK
jgi:hypothetical protein